jgi:hypothetical protein
MVSSSGAGIDYRNIFFEFPELDLITGEPNADSLIKLKKQLKSNASSVSSNLGDGLHGHLGLVSNPTDYALVSQVPFDTPAHPGPLEIPTGTTATMATALRDQHNEAIRIFREFNGVEKALKQQIRKAINESYLLAIHDRTSNSLSGTVHTILDYFQLTYGKVSVSMLDEKEELFKRLGYQAHMPVDVVFNAVEDLLEYASMAQQPFSDCQAVAKAYNIFNKTHCFDRAFTEWNRRNPNKKTMANLKTHFRRAQTELQESAGPTLNNSDLDHRANLVREVVEEVQQTILPALDEDPTVEILQQVANSTSQSTSTQHLLIQQLQGMQNMMSSMQTQLAAVSAVQNVHQQPHAQQPGHGGCVGPGRGGRGGGRGATQPFVCCFNMYCWTHGACAHFGNSCRNKADGHQDTATFQNKMSGSTASCPPGNVAPPLGWQPNTT